mmetsp:Transcript_1262/g.3099  ORF Transcript_1262/g.3099 Transcript_1262/m.3099 type:complete len:732 (-) Transcript_1262:144-2339(-)
MNIEEALNACETAVKEELLRFESGLSVDDTGRIIVDCAATGVEPRIVNLRAKKVSRIPRIAVEDGILDVSENDQLEELPADLEASSLVAQLCSNLKRIGANLKINGGNHMTAEMVAIHKAFFRDSEVEDRLAFWRLLSHNIVTVSDAKALSHNEFVKLGFEKGPCPVQQDWIKEPSEQGYLKYPGDLALDGCVALEELPEDLFVPGYLTWMGTDHRSALKQLPARLHVGGDLDGRESSLEVISPGVRVDGWLRLGGSQIRTLPADLEVGNGVNLFDCANLKELPEGIKIKGNIVLNGSEVPSLPESLQEISGQLLAGVGFQNLMKNLTATSVFLNGADIFEIPSGLHLAAENGILNATSCPNLTVFYTNDFTGRRARFDDCRALERIEGPQAGQSLEAHNCTALVKLPDMLPLESFRVPGCRALERIPVYRPTLDTPVWCFEISDCPRVTSIPASALQIGTSPKRCSFEIVGSTGLDDGALVFLRQYLPSSLWSQALIRTANCSGKVTFSTLSQARDFWTTVAKGNRVQDQVSPRRSSFRRFSSGSSSGSSTKMRGAVVRALSYLRPPSRTIQPQLLHFLYLLRCTREMLMTETQQGFASRICEVLDDLLCLPHVEAYVISEINDDSTSYDALSVLSDLYVVDANSKLADSDALAARDRLSKVRFASKEFRESQNLDQSCAFTIQTAFELAFADVFDLPVSRTPMNIPYFMQPSAEVLELCRKQVTTSSKD